MTYANSLSQIPSEKQVWKKLKSIVFGKRVKCPDCGRQKYVKEIQKNKMFRQKSQLGQQRKNNYFINI